MRAIRRAKLRREFLAALNDGGPLEAQPFNKLMDESPNQPAPAEQELSQPAARSAD